MKVAIPVDEQSLDSKVSQSFGRAPYFLFCTTADMAWYCVENGAAKSEGGAGIKAAQQVADEGAQVLVAPRCGENAGKVLKEAAISVYQSLQGTARENVEAFVADRLAPLGDFHPGLHRHGR